MYTNQLKKIYNITLPPSTSEEVVEWFEIMENSSKLTDALIELVYISIKSRKSLNVSNHFSSNTSETSQTDSSQLETQSDIFNNLYNWQDSNNAIFKEEKKEKRKMLSV